MGTRSAPDGRLKHRVRLALLAALVAALAVALVTGSAAASLLFLVALFGSVTLEMFGPTRRWAALMAVVAVGALLGPLLDSVVPPLIAAAIGLGVAVRHEVRNPP